MLDALVALGLAGNIVQFIDFGIKAAKTVRELYKSADGKLQRLSDMEKEAIGQAESFEAVLQGLVKQGDAKLLQLAKKCSSISEELVSLLRSFQLDPQKNRLMEAASKSLKSHLAKPRMKDIDRQLMKVREEVCTYLLVLLSQQQDELGSRFADLSRLIKSTNVETRLNFKATIAELIQEMKTKSWDTENEDTFTSFAEDLKEFIANAQNYRLALRILNSLNFKQLKDRQSAVRQEHKHTFEWAFDLRSKSNLSTWLQTESGIYWVEGKPGSGKSTLMKFLINNQKTMHLLQQWAGSKSLIVLSHFFWSSGTKLQKSQHGLFRSLLFQIFSYHPEIIPAICSDRRCTEFHPELIGGWDWEELFLAFEKIASFENLPYKLCIFIDGLDEYDGDHVELVEILRAMTKSANIKICASSRPWFDFIDAFGHQKWKLCVQDFTANDILLYIKDNLEQNLRFKKLKQQNDIAATDLVQEIRTKSCGVFLWVYLVVRSLLRGLRNNDRLSDLHRRLYELPGELEKYFELMLDSIEKVYQQMTARIFRVMIAAHGTLPILAFHFLDQEEYSNEYAFQNYVSIPFDQFDTLIDEKKRQLHANCRDLLWVTSQDPSAELLLRDRVGFLHRTVMDFLQTKHMITVLSARAGENFRPAASLSMMHLAMLKTHTQLRRSCIETTHSLVLGVIFYARQSETDDDIAEVLVLKELERLSNTLSLNWQNISGAPDCQSLFDYIVRVGLHCFLLKKISNIPPDDASGSSRALRNALRARLTIEQDVDFTSRTKSEVDLSMLRLLVWSDFLLTLERECPRKNQEPAWDMLTYHNISIPPLQHPENDRNENDEAIKASSKIKALWLPNWFEACELLISRDAGKWILKIENHPLDGKDRYEFASNSIAQIFGPEEARILQQQLKSREPPPSPSIWSRIFRFN